MSHLTSSNPPARGMRGFSLLETLVALLVFALGVSGALTLQLQAQRSATEAVLALRALTLSEELLARSAVHAPLRNAWSDAQGGAAEVCTAQLGCTDTLPGLEDWQQRVFGAAAGPAALPQAQLCVRTQAGRLDVLLAWPAVLGEGQPPTALGGAGGDFASACDGEGHSRVALGGYTGTVL